MAMQQQHTLYLRGNWAKEDSVNEFVNSVVHRSLQKETSGTTTILTALLVALISILTLVCTFQILRKVCQVETDSSSPVATPEDGHLVKNLSGNQRRAILEALFSETSKPATEAGVSQTVRTKSKKKDVAQPNNVEILVNSTTETDTKTPAPPALKPSNCDPTDSKQTPSDDLSEHAIAIHPVPDVDQDIDEANSDDKESTVENVCSICLGEFETGDKLLKSKHCAHVHHQACILEWLDKHDDCPMCRENMVTEDEMNTAATSLVGKTRMCRAVAAYGNNSAPRRTAPTRSAQTAPSRPQPRTRASPFVPQTYVGSSMRR